MEKYYATLKAPNVWPAHLPGIRDGPQLLKEAAAYLEKNK